MSGIQLIQRNGLTGLSIFDDGAGFTASDGEVNCNSLYVNGLPITADGSSVVSKQIIQDISVGDNTMNSITFNTNKGITLSGGSISQTTGSATNNISDTNISGVLTQTGNLTQTAGSTILNDTNVGTLIQENTKYITQTGTTGSNTLRNTYVSDLTITGTLTLPSSISQPTATYTNNNIVMTGTGCIIQSGTGQNQFVNSDFINDATFDGNISQTNATKTSTLQNTTHNGVTNFVGNITQSSGTNVLHDTTISNITSTSITNSTSINSNTIVTTGKVTANTLETNLISNAEFNTLNNIDTTQTIQQQLDTILTSLSNKLGSISVGTITTNTLAAGSSASVGVSINTSLSTPINSVMDFTFGIPRGNTGETGATGATGAKGTAATSIWLGNVTTTTLDAGLDASVTISYGLYDATNKTQLLDFSFGIPKGDKGDKGNSSSGVWGTLNDLFGVDGNPVDLFDITSTSASFIALQIQVVALAGAVAILQSQMTAVEAEVAVLQTQVAVIEADILTIDGQITTLETKTADINYGLSGTTFNRSIQVLTGGVPTIDLNSAGVSTFANSVIIDNDLLVGVDTTLTNVTASGLVNMTGYTINIGQATNFSSVNISSLNTNITGILTINGLPYYPSYMGSSGYFNQFA
jgi:hypothetical protein